MIPDEERTLYLFLTSGRATNQVDSRFESCGEPSASAVVHRQIAANLMKMIKVTVVEWATVTSWLPMIHSCHFVKFSQPPQHVPQLRFPDHRFKHSTCRKWRPADHGRTASLPRCPQVNQGFSLYAPPQWNGSVLPSNRKSGLCTASNQDLFRPMHR